MPNGITIVGNSGSGLKERVYKSNEQNHGGPCNMYRCRGEYPMPVIPILRLDHGTTRLIEFT